MIYKCCGLVGCEKDNQYKLEICECGHHQLEHLAEYYYPFYFHCHKCTCKKFKAIPKDRNIAQKGCGKLIELKIKGFIPGRIYFCGDKRELCQLCQAQSPQSGVKPAKKVKQTSEDTSLSERFKHEYKRYKGYSEHYTIIKRLEVDVKTAIKKLKEELWELLKLDHLRTINRANQDKVINKIFGKELCK